MLLLRKRRGLTATRRRRAFTLVELLVVITIIGILMSLMMPAANMVLESARRTQCKNHLASLGKACRSHQTLHAEQFPTGGWAWGWAGDPDRGYKQNQPGGWAYNLLPFLDQLNLYEAGKDQGEAAKRAAGKLRAETPLAVLTCPTRGVARTIPYTGGPRFLNIDPPAVIARTDYAANTGQGDANTDWAGDGAENLSDSSWRSKPGSAANGVIYRRSTVRNIEDGTSHTYLFGEKYLDPDAYEFLDPSTKGQGWNIGYDSATHRWVNASPRHDTPSVKLPQVFGSPHTNGVNMVFCDGHVQTIPFAIDAETHRRLGNRKDGQHINVTRLQ